MSRLFENVRKWHTLILANARIVRYLVSGRNPWTLGYEEYKEATLRNVLKDQDLLKRFLHNRVLPRRYGLRIDERAVEYPWVLSRLGASDQLLLDAGSCLNHRYVLDFSQLRSCSIVMYSIAAENIARRSNVSYVYGDLRRTALRSECFDVIVCISTLEHVGMDNTFLYSDEPRFDEFKPDDYQIVVGEFKRLLKPGGKLFITVPYGRYENLGWLQQFDYNNIERILKAFGGSATSIVHYKYLSDGWQVSHGDACENCSYFDIHKRSDYEPDYVAAARCVACIELVK